MAKTVYIKTALTGGTLDALDGIDGANLLDGDVAYVYVNGIKYEYVLDDDSGAAEDVPNVIVPDTNAGDKRWILQGATFESVTLQNVPTVNSHAATKEYVDHAVAASVWTFFLTDDSADVSGYYYLKDEETGETLSELTSPTLAAGDDQLLWSFVTESGDPGIDLLSLGVYTATMFLYKSGNKTVNIYWKLFKRDSGDVETELMTSGISDDLTDSRSQYILSSYINSDIALDTTDRIVLKLYANVSGTGTDPTVTISIENNYDSRIALRVGSSAFANVFVKKSGDTITGDLDIQGNLTSSAIDSTPIGQTTPAAGAFTTLKQTTGAALGKVPVSDADGNLTLSYRPLENLLDNSGFGVWSNGTLADYTDPNTGFSDLVTNGGFDTDTTGWTAGNGATLASVTGGQSGNALEITEAGTANPYAYQAITTEVGKLYRLKFYCSPGTEATFDVKVGTSAGGDEVTSYGQTEAVDWLSKYSIVFEATATTTYISLYQIAGAGSGTTILFDTITLSEVTPACVEANTLGPDGWGKDAGLKLYRVHWDGGTNTRDGSFYALKIVNTDASNSRSIAFMYGKTNVGSWLQKWYNRTIALGLFARASSVGGVTLRYYVDGYGTYNTSTTTSWEWLEGSITVGSGASNISPAVITIAAGATAYISQPMLVFGSSIGEGNYAPKPNETIWFESAVGSNKFHGVHGWSSVTGNTLLNLEADSNGAIPKGAKAVFITGVIRDSGSSLANAYVDFASGTNLQILSIDVSGKADDFYGMNNGFVGCTSDGNIYYRIFASGASTLDFLVLKYLGVQLR